ncbi:GNAT family N-acetyltransferase [Sporobolomyces koalae]|uniref:GNAT family N-acetyltransferase n=1 Tax=Sporobolomyces koalae TaxID=500713 RepID=UPI00316F415A
MSTSPPRSDTHSTEREHVGFGLSLSRLAQESISERTPFKFHSASTESTVEACDQVEPYLALSHPRYSLILTPARPTDFDVQTECLNDWSVTSQLIGPPYPYSREMAADWANMKWEETRHVFNNWAKQVEQEGDQVELEPIQQGLPFSTIRIQDTGEWIGEIGINRWIFRDVADVDERDRLKRENDERKVGDRELVWSFGYYLLPKYQGQGIMTAALASLIESYYIPYLDAYTIRSSAFVDNVASVRVQEKCGLKQNGMRHWFEVSESRGGGKREECTLEWTREA